MPLAVCVSPNAFALDGAVGGVRWGGMAISAAVDVASPDQWLAQQEAAIQKEAAEKKDGQLDIWASIQSSKESNADLPTPYVHPLVRRSASSLSQKSLEICTESLGSETGSEGMLSSDDLEDFFSTWKTEVEEELVDKKPEGKDGTGPHQGEVEMEEHVEPMPPPPPLPPHRRRKLGSVNYHCSISRRSPPRSFPPPLPSISRSDGPCLSMRRHRLDGRLVVEAVPVPSQNYLHAQRQGGRLVLTFIETNFQDIYPENEEPVVEQVLQQQQQEKRGAQAEPEEAEAEAEAEAEEYRGPVESVAGDDADNVDVAIDDEEVGDEEGEEEVEVVDKGIVVEVKVSRPPLPQSGGLKVQRSSVVINKFVGVPLCNQSPWAEQAAAATAAPPRWLPVSNSTTTTATAVVAAAAAASSSLSTDERYWRSAKGPQSAQRHPSPEKLYFTSKRLTNRQDLLHQVRRCSEHHRPLFIWEPCCIATS